METITEQKEISALAQLREKLSRKAKLEPKFRFYTLYHHISRNDVLIEAWRLVKENRGAAGIDGITIKMVETSSGGVSEFLNQIQDELRNKKYHPKPVKRVFIPKSDGKLRPLGIPTVKDRVVQTALLLIIEPIFEQDFLECSYGFRPGKSAHQAIDAIKDAIQQKKQLQVYDADLKSYFDTIPHDKLIQAIEFRIADQQVIKLIRKWLKAPVWEPGKPMNTNTTGTPQGGVISPLLANIYLHWFDKIFHGPSGPGTWARATLVRYADDMVIMANYLTDKLKLWIENTLEGRFKLIINREKTKIINLGEPRTSLDFLGFSFKKTKLWKAPRKEFCLMTPSKKSMKNAKEAIKMHTCSKKGYQTITEQVKRLNLFLRGWGQYFSKGNPSKAFGNINGYVNDRMYRSLQRRSQKGYRERNKDLTWYRLIKDKLGVIILTKQYFRKYAYR